MGTGLHVEVTDRDRRPIGRFEAPSFPVRFGREPLLNDVVLENGGVSSYHALVEHEGGRLFVCDLGSRNGTSAGTSGQRLAPNVPVDLSPHGNQFVVGELTVTIHLAEVPDARAEGDGSLRSSITGKLLRTARVDAAETIARSVEASAVAGELEPNFQEYRRAWATFIAALSQRLTTLPPKVRADAVKLVAQRHRAIVNEPEFQQLCEQYGVPANDQRDARRALAVMQELSAFFLDKSLSTEAEISAFGKKVRQTLEAFITSFIPLRNGLRSFERDIVRGQDVHRSNPLETASTLAEVALLLLDWTESRDSGLRSIFADIMTHQMSLISGVMDGARALVDDLSPAKIASDLREGRRRSRPSGLEFGPFRVRAMWREFTARHRDYSSEETFLFKMVFGSAFAETYLNHFGTVAQGGFALTEGDAPPEVQPAEAAERVPSPVIARSAAETLLKTPENQGRHKPRIGPTGTMVVPRGPVPLPNSELAARRSPAPPAAARGSRDDELKLPSVVLSTPASSKRK